MAERLKRAEIDVAQITGHSSFSGHINHLRRRHHLRPSGACCVHRGRTATDACRECLLLATLLASSAAAAADGWSVFGRSEYCYRHAFATCCLDVLMH